MSTRPLSYGLRQLPNGLFVTDYGTHSYVTNDDRFCITYYGDGWRVTTHLLTLNEEKILCTTGLFGECFERRKDAVHAIETVLDEVGIA